MVEPPQQQFFPCGDQAAEPFSSNDHEDPMGGDEVERALDEHLPGDPLGDPAGAGSPEVTSYHRGASVGPDDV
ncbi:hypothetical protein [Nonomuraea sp. NPDC048901]|uniref:hypothetical protein n=1 Tax=Nonomuraea sp. NPDC048901 TaxID=3155627 RepID=UPI003408368D